MPSLIDRRRRCRNGINPGDAVLALQAYLGNAALDECGQAQANVLAPPTSSITPADALRIFQSFLGLPSCITTRFLAGVVSKRAVMGAIIALFFLNPDGTQGEQIAATTMTDASGAWTVELSAQERDPHFWWLLQVASILMKTRGR